MEVRVRPFLIDQDMLSVTRAQNILRLISKLDSFVGCLDKKKNLGLHSQVDQFYYMTRVVELRYLWKQYEDGRGDASTIVRQMNITYEETFLRWQKDVRWANRHLVERGLTLCNQDVST